MLTLSAMAAPHRLPACLIPLKRRTGLPAYDLSRPRLRGGVEALPLIWPLVSPGSELASAWIERYGIAG